MPPPPERKISANVRMVEPGTSINSDVLTYILSVPANSNQAQFSGSFISFVDDSVTLDQLRQLINFIPNEFRDVTLTGTNLITESQPDILGLNFPSVNFGASFRSVPEPSTITLLVSGLLGLLVLGCYRETRRTHEVSGAA
jgi:hypothetical protein